MIKNIIFDFGGVLLNLDFKRTENAFVELGVTDFSERYSQFAADDLFKNLETGDVPAYRFYEAIQKLVPGATDEAIEKAWNAMLLTFRKETIPTLQYLKGKYKTYLFSNTNIIHENAFRKIIKDETGITDFDGLFTGAYYSHKMRLRKPDAPSFQKILRDNALRAEETLFVDDTLPNIEAAKALGLQVWHLQKNETIEDVVRAKGL